jgi:hypothetical protein
MTASTRQLDAVADDLGPTGLVLRWLAEAHAYDDMESCVLAAIEGAMGGPPMDRLAREAMEWAQRQTRRGNRAESGDLVRRAVTAALFRVQLVLRINVVSHDFLDREVLMYAALTAHMGLAMEVSREDRKVTCIDQMRDLMLKRVFEIHALEAARDEVEARYLAGTPALFPAGRRAWDDQRDLSEKSAVMAIRIGELDGFGEPPPDDPAAFDARVAQLVADHVEPSRSTTYDEMGDGRRAYSIASNWVMTKVERNGKIRA